MNFFHNNEYDDDDDLGLGRGIETHNFGNGTLNPMQTPSKPIIDLEALGSLFTTPVATVPVGARVLPPLEEAPEKATNALFVGHESALGRTPIEELLEKGDKLGALDEGFKSEETTAAGYNFGWIEGVYVRCTLSIFGVIMFLRLNWVFAMAGVGGAIGIILYSVSVTSITTMSLSAISTNGKVAAGGVYFMVSRCLGAEVGAVVGLSLFAAQALAVALNVMGFGEACVSLESEFMIDRDWDVKIFAIIGLIACFGISFCGANFEVNAQKVLCVSMVVALLMFFIGVGVAKNDPGGLNSTPVSSETLNMNLKAAYSKGESWLTVFGVFFPAVTGISAGSSISGDLKDASDAIPKGTFLAVLTTTVIYLLMGILMAACFTPEGLANITTHVAAIEISVFPPLVYLGVFAAGLSSALALIVGAPRVLMALARDDVVSWLAPFKVGYFAMDEPLRGYILVLSIAFIAILTLDLNAVAPLTTNFYLVQYGLINYSVSAAHFSKAPGWRPSFKYYNAYVCMLGAVLCVASMFMVGYVTAIVSLVLSIGIYQYVVMKKPQVNWGASTQAAMHISAVRAMYALERSQTHVKNWRPQYLFLTGNLEERPDLIIAMKLMKKSRGIVIAGNVIIGDLLTKYSEHAYAELHGNVMDNGIEGFTSVVVAPTLLEGAMSLLQISGLGKLKANTVILGFKYHWQEDTIESLEMYRDIMRISFLTRHGVGIVKNLKTNNHLILKPTQQPAIDVWWLVEDGGLTLLSAHLLIRHREYREHKTKLRLFIASTEEQAQEERAKLQDMLKRFRIVATIIIVDKNAQPSRESMENFQALAKCSDEELLDPQLVHFVNISEQMRKYSEKATLVVSSLPFPNKGVPIRTYFAFLEILTEIRPTVLIRGNQDTVLTYNS